MLHLNQALHDRAELRQQAQALLDTAQRDNRALDDTEARKFEVLSGKLREINAAIENHQRQAILSGPEPYANSPAFPPVRVEGASLPLQHKPMQSISRVLRDALLHASAEQREQVEHLANYLRGGIVASADLRPGADGGFLIPEFVQTIVERNYSAFAPVASVARLFPTATGADVKFPVLSDSESAEQLDAAAATGADDTVSGDTPPTELTGPSLKAYKVSSKPIFLPRETMTDSTVDIVNEVIGALLARIIRFENARFTKGTGTGQAEGFLTNATPFEHSGGVLDLDVALDLQYSVPALYRSNGVYMASDTTIKYLRQLATGISGDKRKLWNDADFTRGTPATLHGAPIFPNNDMTDVAADGTYSAGCPLAFGDFKRFVIRQAENNAPYLRRYEVPAKDGQAVILFRRTDSKLLVAEAISKLTVGGS